MSDHLTSSVLNSLADGELSAEPLASAQEHLAGCPACTSNALSQMMLKQATAKAGQRYAAPQQLLERISRQAAQEGQQLQGSRSRTAPRAAGRFGVLGWAAAAALVLVCVSGVLLQRRAQRTATASAEYGALITEVSDQHIATLAANAPPQVLSSDRHTVKPWFQGKIPFSFNLPENLPADTRLDGANLTYLHNQPVAQLLYSIGRHRVSVFVEGRAGAIRGNDLAAEYSGFHVRGFRTEDLEVVAVSDVDASRLSGLVSLIEQSQTGSQAK